MTVSIGAARRGAAAVCKFFLQLAAPATVACLDSPAAVAE